LTETKITITAVIPAYNVGQYIARAIESVLAQTHPANEIIVVDDGSSDNTVEVVRCYGDKVRLVQQANGGASAARNTGINAAASDWIAFLDADDEWLPNMLQLQTDILRQYPDMVWTTGNYKRCFCRRGYMLIQEDEKHLQPLLDNKPYFPDYFDAFVHKVRGCTNCMVIRKDVLLELGCFCTLLPKANDIDMWFRIAYRYPQIGFVAEPLSIYHMETGDSLASHHMDCDYLKQFLQRHFDLAEDAGRLEQFAPCARQMLQAWIRSGLFDDRVHDIRKMIQSFSFLLSANYKCTLWLMTILPGLTKGIFKTLSRISRTLKLRRQTWHTKAEYKRKDTP